MSKAHRKKQRGYTLIEVLIATSIVAILVAIALPIYTNFMTRSKLTEAMALATMAKNAVVEYYYINGAFPRENAHAGLSEPVEYRSEYVRALSVNVGGEIVIALQGDLFVGHSLIYQGAPSGGAIQWQCVSTLPQNLLPPSCTSAGP